ncbi:PucR family transcriptional regulator [Paenibacillus sp. GCM10027628]|uniref:PucR family transcriptional regulator n=1 Tax=Paenibacillus sp. GCM10027628 TaxID=3273413 RepID=UPI00363C96DA
MKVIEALQLPSLQPAKVVAGAEGLHRTIRWVSIVDLPDPLSCVSSGDLLLTTGYGWPRDEKKLQELIVGFSKCGLAGIGLAVPEYFANMPLSVRKIADELKFPIIEIPWEVQFNHVTEEILSSILTYQYNLQEQSEFIHQELMRIALDANDLQEIALTLGQLIKRNVIIQHPEGPVLAAYNLDKDGFEAKEQLFNQEMFVFRKEQVQHVPLGSLSKPIRIASEPEAGVPERVLCPISIKRELVGLLWIIEGQQPLREVDLRAAQSASIVMALHIAQQRALASLEAQLGYSFLDSLFESESSTTPQLLRRAELLGFEPDGIYSVGAFIMDASVPLTRDGIVKRERLAEKLKRSMQELKIPSVLSLTQNQIIFLIPDRVPSEEIWKSMKDANLSLAVSIPHRGFNNVRLGYREVNSILPHIQFGQLHRYQDLLVPRVLMGDLDARSSFLSKLFDPLQRNKNGKVLIHTLLAYANQGFQLNKTAEELNIHPKTMRYRLDRAITLGDFDLEKAETQFHLQLAVRLYALENQEH